MKIYTTYLSLTLSIAPLAFWEMEGLFALNYNNSIERINEAVPLKNFDNKIRLKKQYPYMYNYCYQNGYSIGYVIEDPKEFLRAPLVNNFLLGQDLEYYKDYLYKSLRFDYITFNPVKFYFVKEKPGVNQIDNTKELLEGARLASLVTSLKNGDNCDKIKHILEEIRPPLTTERITDNDVYFMINCFYKKNNNPEIKIKPLNIEDRFGTWQSEVMVINQGNKVEIKKEGKTLDFQEALINYYDPNLSQLAGELSRPKTSKTFEKLRFSTTVGKKEVQKLRNSKIISVYAVIKGDHKKNSIIWGLAEDNNTKRRFHWITDLEEDISILFNKK